jgi:ABC-type uncharacterized transport system ATPase subunit
MNGLTVMENLWLAARRAHGWTRATAEVQRVIDEVGLGEIARRTVGQLAHGQRQMVEIGIVLAQDPWLILLDEPAAGITGAEVEKLVTLIRQINQNASVIVVDHDMEFVRMLGAGITVFYQGAVLTEGPADQVLNDTRVREVYIGNRA